MAEHQLQAAIGEALFSGAKSAEQLESTEIMRAAPAWLPGARGDASAPFLDLYDGPPSYASAPSAGAPRNIKIPTPAPDPTPPGLRPDNPLLPRGPGSTVEVEPDGRTEFPEPTHNRDVGKDHEGTHLFDLPELQLDRNLFSELKKRAPDSVLKSLLNLF